MASITPVTTAEGALSWRPVRDAVIVGIALAFALLTLYSVFVDQGALLAPILGQLSFDQNFIHEFTHDARHLAGAPCH